MVGDAGFEPVVLDHNPDQTPEKKDKKSKEVAKSR
jgi:hypothetical protein